MGGWVRVVDEWGGFRGKGEGDQGMVSGGMYVREGVEWNGIAQLMGVERG